MTQHTAFLPSPTIPRPPSTQQGSQLPRHPSPKQGGRQQPPSHPWLRRIVVTLGPLEEWRGKSQGEIVKFESDGTPKGLKVTASFEKTLMGTPNPSEIAVYNLARDTRDAIRANLTKITIEAGWKNRELHTLFQGSVLSVASQRSGTDIVTTIKALPGYGALVRGISSKSYASGTPVRDVVMDIAKDLPGLTIDGSGIEGINGSIGHSGWSFAGSTRDALTQLGNEHGFSWHINDGAFKALGDTARYGGVLQLNGKNGGLISVAPNLTGPLQSQTGVKIQAVYVPGLMPGGGVAVNSEISPGLNGEYRVHTCNISIDAYSDQWTMDIDAFQ